MRDRSPFAWILFPFALAYGLAYPVRVWIRAQRDQLSFADAAQRMTFEAEDAAARQGMFVLPDGRILEAGVVSDIHADPTLGPLWELRIDGDPPITGQPLNSALAELLGEDVAHTQWPSWIDDFAARIEATRNARISRPRRIRPKR